MDQMKVLNETEGDKEPTVDADKRTEERGEGGFFLTGVNVTGNDVVDVEMPAAAMDEQSDEPTSEEEVSPEKVDKYKLVAVVDSAKTFSANDVSIV